MFYLGYTCVPVVRRIRFPMIDDDCEPGIKDLEVQHYYCTSVMNKNDKKGDETMTVKFERYIVFKKGFGYGNAFLSTHRIHKKVAHPYPHVHCIFSSHISLVIDIYCGFRVLITSSINGTLI